MPLFNGFCRREVGMCLKLTREPMTNHLLWQSSDLDSQPNRPSFRKPDLERGLHYPNEIVRAVYTQKIAECTVGGAGNYGSNAEPHRTAAFLI
jgi:hypothetical protein